MRSFCYAQARLQSRHGQRMDEDSWRRLASIDGFDLFLKQARETSLARWLPSVGPTSTHEEADRALRLHFREHVAEVASWLPGEWRPATLWIATLADLASVSHLFAGLPPFPWMLRDPVLAPLCQGDADWGGFNKLVVRWQSGEPPVSSWLNHWRSLFPKNSKVDPPLAALLTILQEAGAQLAAGSDAETSQAIRRAMTEKLARLFRRALFHPTVAFTHLALVALEMERLRGAVCRRLLFPTTGFEAAT